MELYNSKNPQALSHRTLKVTLQQAPGRVSIGYNASNRFHAYIIGIHSEPHGKYHSAVSSIKVSKLYHSHPGIIHDIVTVITDDWKRIEFIGNNPRVSSHLFQNAISRASVHASQRQRARAISQPRGAPYDCDISPRCSEILAPSIIYRPSKHTRASRPGCRIRNCPYTRASERVS